MTFTRIPKEPYILVNEMIKKGEVPNDSIELFIPLKVLKTPSWELLLPSLFMLISSIAGLIGYDYISDIAALISLPLIVLFLLSVSFSNKYFICIQHKLISINNKKVTFYVDHELFETRKNEITFDVGKVYSLKFGSYLWIFRYVIIYHEHGKDIYDIFTVSEKNINMVIDFMHDNLKHVSIVKLKSWH